MYLCLLYFLDKLIVTWPDSNSFEQAFVAYLMASAERFLACLDCTCWHLIKEQIIELFL